MDTYPLSYRMSCVKEWAKDKGILDNPNPRAQAHKTIEESSELLEAVVDDEEPQIEVEMGDILVTLIVQAEMQGMHLEDCLQRAYEKIRDRKGRMENGTFVKEES